MSAIVISASKENVLSKQQQQFNKLVKSIEKERKAIVDREKKLDNLLNEYLEKIVPAADKLNKKRFDILQLLDSYYNNSATTKKAKEQILEIILFVFDEIFNEKEPDEEEENLYNKYSQKTYKEEIDEQKKDILQEFQEKLKMFTGIEIDVDNIENTAEGFAKFQHQFQHQLHEKIDEQNKQKSSNRKKTAKQIEKENKEAAIEELKTKNLRSIYVSLAKLLHPDTETDIELKKEKEEIMKKITVAYESQDLSTLLTLEIEWVHKNNTHLHQLKDDVLKMYCQVLKEQLNNLKEEKFALNNNPKYSSVIEESFLGVEYDVSIPFKLNSINKEFTVLNKIQDNLLINHPSKNAINDKHLNELYQYYVNKSKKAELENNLFSNFANMF